MDRQECRFDHLQLHCLLLQRRCLLHRRVQCLQLVPPDKLLDLERKIHLLVPPISQSWVVVKRVNHLDLQLRVVPSKASSFVRSSSGDRIRRGNQFEDLGTFPLSRFEIERG